MEGKVRFKKIEFKSKYSQIIEQLLGLIKTGVYRTGDRLPNERALAEEMAVSRGSLREALKALEILGIIESRQGDGTYISNITSGRGHAYVFLEDAPLEQLIQAREIIDLGCATLGINGFAPEDLIRLERQLEEMKISKNLESHERYLQASLNFHLTFVDILVKKDGNFVRNIVNYLWRATNLALSKEMYDDYMVRCINEYIEMHDQILEGIRNRSLQLTQKALKEHYRFIKNQLSSKSKESTRR